MREGSIYAIIYSIVWCVFFFKIFRKYGKYSISVFVIFFYLLYSILAILLYNHVEYVSDFNTLTLFPYVYLFLMILLCLRPVITYDKSNVQGLIVPTQSVVHTFTYCFIFLAIILLPSAIYDMKSGITMLLLDSNGGADLYVDAHGGGPTQRSIADIPKFLFEMFSYISILIFYYYLTQARLKKWVLVGLSIAMIYNMLRPISLGLRTDTVMTIFAILAGFILIRKWIPQRRRTILIIIGSSFGGLIFSLIMILSISRFSNSAGGVSGTNLDYIAQSSLNFNNYGLDAGGIRNGDRTCRIFKKYLGFENVPSGIIDRRRMYYKMKMNDGVFYTFVGDFTLDFGPITTVLIFIIYSLWFTHMSKIKNGVISFSKMLVVYLAILIPLQGGMYLFTFSDGGNYTLMAFLFTAILFNYVDSRKLTRNILWISNKK